MPSLPNKFPDAAIPGYGDFYRSDQLPTFNFDFITYGKPVIF